MRFINYKHARRGDYRLITYSYRFSSIQSEHIVKMIVIIHISIKCITYTNSIYNNIEQCKIHYTYILRGAWDTNGLFASNFFVCFCIVISALVSSCISFSSSYITAEIIASLKHDILGVLITKTKVSWDAKQKKCCTEL